MKQSQGARSELAEALSRCRAAFVAVGVVSGLINLLMLTAPLFMLQVYDRVLPSRSVPTLIGLAILTACLFAFQGILDVIRGRVLQRVGGSLNEELSTRAYDAVARLPLETKGSGDGLQPIRDLDQIRGFLGTSGPSALFDLPWMPLYVFVCFLFHPLIGIAASIAGLLLVTLTLTTEVVSQKPAKAANQHAAQRNALLEATRRNAEVVHALGMGPAMTARFAAINDNFIHAQSSTSDRAGMLGAISRVTRLIVQSFVLGLGAYLVINQEATAGVIIASSILVSRSLAPVEQAIANWRGFVTAREAYARMNKLLTLLPERKQILPLPQACACVARRGGQRKSARRDAPRRAGRDLRAQERDGAGHHRSECLGKVVAGPTHRRRVAAAAGQGQAGRRGARSVVTGGLGPAYRIFAAGSRAVRRHDRAEYQPL